MLLKSLTNLLIYLVSCRSQREYDDGHITKPPRHSANVPFAAGQAGAPFVGQVSSKFPSKAAKLIVVSCRAGGMLSPTLLWSLAGGTGGLPAAWALGGCNRVAKAQALGW